MPIRATHDRTFQSNPLHYVPPIDISPWTGNEPSGSFCHQRREHGHQPLVSSTLHCIELCRITGITFYFIYTYTIAEDTFCIRKDISHVVIYNYTYIYISIYIHIKSNKDISRCSPKCTNDMSLQSMFTFAGIFILRLKTVWSKVLEDYLARQAIEISPSWCISDGLCVFVQYRVSWQIATGTETLGGGLVLLHFSDLIYQSLSCDHCFVLGWSWPANSQTFWKS